MHGDCVQKWIGRCLTIGAVLLGIATVATGVMELTFDPDLFDSYIRVTFVGALICVVGWIVHVQRIQVGDVYQAGYDVGLQDGYRKGQAQCGCGDAVATNIRPLTRAAVGGKGPRPAPVRRN